MNNQHVPEPMNIEEPILENAIDDNPPIEPEPEPEKPKGPTKEDILNSIMNWEDEKSENLWKYDFGPVKTYNRKTREVGKKLNNNSMKNKSHSTRGRPTKKKNENVVQRHRRGNEKKRISRKSQRQISSMGLMST
eukprot:UN30243